MFELTKSALIVTAVWWKNIRNLKKAYMSRSRTKNVKMLLSSQHIVVEELIAHMETIFCPNVGLLATDVEMIVAFFPAANFVVK
jgi:hypothetical protein